MTALNPGESKDKPKNRHNPNRFDSQLLKIYPPEAIGNPKRIEKWDNPKKNGRIRQQTFRPATVEAYREYIRFQWKVKDLGSDTCYIICSYAQSFNAFHDGLEAKDPKALIGANVINFQQQNQFNYMPQVPRREPLHIRNPGISGTITNRALEAYVLLEALRLNHTFSCRNFRELGSNTFRKVISRLKYQGFIEPIEPRTWPRFYRLTHKFLIPLAEEYYYKISECSHGHPKREGAH